MPLSAGDKLGAYEIVSPLGKGGMGEVWRAHDPRLGRDVAIKVSAQQFTDRFEREARAIAALNHTNICTLFDVGPNYLVMELIDGPTLADRIQEGPIPLEEALGYAKQIADGLEAAHEKNIVHRDLKPANVKIRPDGSVKVLDFGLAKAGAAQEVTADSPTLVPGTQIGMILGTAGYMSPEQARGKEVDQRADIWAFGVVLYEMVTGKRLFAGETVSDALAAVLTREPDWTSVPEKVRRLLRACLQKDPKQRLQAIGDWPLPIADLQTQPIDPSWSRLGWGVMAGVLAVTALVASWIAWQERRPAEPKRLVRLDVDLGADVSLPAAPKSVIISPNGTRLVYLSGNPPRLFTRRLDQTKAIELPGTEGASVPFFSPDGQWVGFNAGNKLYKISAEGGAAVLLADIPNSFGASWGENDTIVVGGAVTRGMVKLPSGGGAFTPVTELASGEIAHVEPQILPGGKAVLFTAYVTPGGADNATVEVLALGDRHRKILVRGATSARYLPSGHLVYVSKGSLFAIPFDLGSLEAHGTPTPVLAGKDSLIAAT